MSGDNPRPPLLCLVATARLHTSHGRPYTHPQPSQTSFPTLFNPQTKKTRNVFHRNGLRAPCHQVFLVHVPPAPFSLAPIGRNKVRCRAVPPPNPNRRLCGSGDSTQGNGGDGSPLQRSQNLQTPYKRSTNSDRTQSPNIRMSNLRHLNISRDATVLSLIPNNGDPAPR